MNRKFSKAGDLTKLATDLEAVFKKHFKERPGMAVAFTLPSRDAQDVHWVTNLSRGNGIALFRDTAAKMAAQVN